MIVFVISDGHCSMVLNMRLLLMLWLYVLLVAHDHVELCLQVFVFLKQLLDHLGLISKVACELLSFG